MMKRTMIQAIAALLASPAAAIGATPAVPDTGATPAFPGPVISSETFGRAEYVQFGGTSYGAPCTASTCTIYSGGPAVLSVDRLSVGTYVINYAAGTWAEPPTCTAIGGGTPQVAFAIKPQSSLPTLTSFTLAFPTTNGGIVDQFVSATCMGPYR